MGIHEQREVLVVDSVAVALVLERFVVSACRNQAAKSGIIFGFLVGRLDVEQAEGLREYAALVEARNEGALLVGGPR